MPSRAASLAVSAITDAPVSIMKLSWRPSMRPSTWKCPRASRGTIIDREFAAAATGAAGATGRAASAADAGLAGLAPICVAYRGTSTLAANARAAKTTMERMRQAELVYGISSQDSKWLANASPRPADFGADGQPSLNDFARI